MFFRVPWQGTLRLRRDPQMSALSPSSSLSYPTGWYAWLLPGELRNGRAIRVQRFGRYWAVWKDDSGEVRVIADRCPHRGASLAQGQLKDGCLACPFHGFRYNGEGRCVAIPAHGKDGKIPRTMRASCEGSCRLCRERELQRTGPRRCSESRGTGRRGIHPSIVLGRAKRPGEGSDPQSPAPLPSHLSTQPNIDQSAERESPDRCATRQVGARHTSRLGRRDSSWAIKLTSVGLVGAEVCPAMVREKTFFSAV